MISEKPFLSDIAGILHVGQPWINSQKPENIINYWSTGIRTYDFIRDYGPLENISIEQTRSYSGRYCFKRHYLEPYIYIDLIDGPRTHSTKVDIVPIPRPKVRAGIKTRWNNDRWEKELKSGWCAA